MVDQTYTTAFGAARISHNIGITLVGWHTNPSCEAVPRRPARQPNALWSASANRPPNALWSASANTRAGHKMRCGALALIGHQMRCGTLALIRAGHKMRCGALALIRAGHQMRCGALTLIRAPATKCAVVQWVELHNPSKVVSTGEAHQASMP